MENYKLEKLMPTVNARVRHYHCDETDKKRITQEAASPFVLYPSTHPPLLAKPSRQPASKEEMWFRGAAPDPQNRI